MPRLLIRAPQIHLYNAALHFRYQVPVRSAAVLLRPEADFGELTGKLAYVCGGKQVEFEYDVVRMWKEPLEPYLHGGLGLLPLATLCQMPERVPREHLRAIYDGVRIMHESTAFDEILDEGRLEGEVRLLLRLGQKRFGPADSATETALKATKDLERLERMGEAILSANCWQDVLATQ